jgi:hypothetical protein
MKNRFLMKFLSGLASNSDWTYVYESTDAWESELVRSALINSSIRAIVRSDKYIIDSNGKKRRNYVVLTPESNFDEAQLVLENALMVISNKEKFMQDQDDMESQIEKSKINDDIQEIPEPIPYGEPVLIAEKRDVGKIFHYPENDVYEIRCEFDFYKASHFMTAEDWDEFTNFSAQRQEFFILLRERYPKLAFLLKENKKRPDFLKLVEYSYGKSQPPQ